MSAGIGPTWAPGTLGTDPVTPSVVVSLVGAVADPTPARSLTDDEFFELFLDAGRQRGWALDQSSDAGPQAKGEALGECYDAGLTRSSGADHVVVAWCHVGVIHPSSSARTLLTEFASCLDDVVVRLGTIDLVGLQATLRLDESAASPPVAAEGRTPDRVRSAALMVERATDDPSRAGSLDLSEVSSANLDRHLSVLRSAADGSSPVDVEPWDAATLGAVAGEIADDLASSGTHGEHRITLIGTDR